MEKEMFNSYSHMLAAIVAFITTIILVVNIESGIENQIVAAVYGICAGLVMTFSAVYHFKKEQDDEISFWRKVDHSAIFLVVAGSFTPLVYVFTSGTMQIGIIVAQWTFVVLGILFKFKYMDAPRWMSLGVYVLMGLMALIPLNQILDGLRSRAGNLELLFWLGIASIIMGIFVYGTKKPDPLPEKLGFHGIWHILVIICLIFLFVLMFKIFI